MTGDLLQPPRDDRDLIAAARHGHVLGYDNLSGIRVDLADSLCRLATGSEIGGRALYSDHDTASFAACRPLILNGIPDLAARADLVDRAIVMRLAPLDRRVTEKDYWRSVEKALPGALAALLKALSHGLHRLDDVPTPEARMADFAGLIVAAEPALPWRRGAFLSAYAANRQHAVAVIVEEDLVAKLIRDFAEEHPSGWSGLTSSLYELLSLKVSSEAKRSGDWPGNARWFGDRLRQVQSALRRLGICVNERRVSRGVELTVSTVATVAAAGAAATEQSAKTYAGTASMQQM